MNEDGLIPEHEIESMGAGLPEGEEK